MRIVGVNIFKLWLIITKRCHPGFNTKGNIAKISLYRFAVIDSPFKGSSFHETDLVVEKSQPYAYFVPAFFIKVKQGINVKIIGFRRLIFWNFSIWITFGPGPECFIIII